MDTVFLIDGDYALRFFKTFENNMKFITVLAQAVHSGDGGYGAL